MYTAIANARMIPLLRSHVTHYKHKVQPLGWTNNPFLQISGFALDAHKINMMCCICIGLGRFGNLQRLKITLCQSKHPFSTLYKSFLKYFTLTNKAEGTLSRPCPNLLRVDRVLILIPSDCRSGGLLWPLDLNSLPDGRSRACSNGYHQIFLYTGFITIDVCVLHISDISALFVFTVGPLKGGLCTHF